MAKWLRNTEKHSELLGGAGKILEETEEDEFLMRTLLDMQTESSQQSSYQISKKMLSELDRSPNYTKSPQHASLAVLTAPDIPSILVEVGFISNPREEKTLNWAAHRERLRTQYTKVLSIFSVRLRRKGRSGQCKNTINPLSTWWPVEIPYRVSLNAIGSVLTQLNSIIVSSPMSYE